MKVFLSASELERGRRVADLRNSKAHEVPNYRETRAHNDWEVHFAGTRGELAACKIFGFPLDEHFAYGGDDGAPDLFAGRNGEYSVEVKTAFYYPPILKLNRLTDFRSDIVIVCYVRKSGHREESLVELCGVVSKQEFLRSHYVHDFGQGDRVCLDIAKMIEPATWLEMVGREAPIRQLTLSGLQ
jgi:hypothetical protein